MTKDDEAIARSQALLGNLSRELFQTEESAARHCRREADRLGQTPPALALHAVADHADSILEQLPGLAKRHHMPVSWGGKRVGDLFSELRDKVADRLIDRERSYRGTLLGCRHGQDVVRTLGHLAAALGDLELDAFCTAWLTTRGVLVERLEEELAWFAQHPAQALQPAQPWGPRWRAYPSSAHS